MTVCFPECRIHLEIGFILKSILISLTLLHSERPKLYTILVFLSAIGLRVELRRKKKMKMAVLLSMKLYFSP